MSCRRKSGSAYALIGIFSLLAIFVFAASALAQDQPPPKVDIFAGYQWLNPGGKLPTPGHPSNAPVGAIPPSMPAGGGATATYNFSPLWGLSTDFGYNEDNSYGYETTFSVGPRLMWRTEGANLFLHTLLSYNHVRVDGLSGSNGIGSVLGGGMDLPIFKHISWRLFEADYVWAHHNFASSVDPSFPDLRRPSMNGARLRTGIVFNLAGGPPPPPLAASCSVQPSEVMVGEPVTATVNVTGADPKHTLAYAWSANGGKINGKDTTASIDTAGLAGGSYTATAHVTDAKRKKDGEATCSASFTVKEPPKNPPTMSCSASPATLQTGGTANLTCTCTSPDNVPVTVSGWTATAGTVSGSGSNATLNTTGAPAGPITVTASCSDSRGLSTSANAQVNVEVPPPPPPQASKLSSCDFNNMDKIKKPWRVDNECKAILDDVAKNLQQNAENKLVIVGNAEPAEKRKNLAAERAVNSKAYLSGGESKLGIDPSRIETRTGNAGTKTAEYWIVPSGATFSMEGTSPVDESMVKPVPDHPHVAPKKGAAKKAQ